MPRTVMVVTKFGFAFLARDVRVGGTVREQLGAAAKGIDTPVEGAVFE